MKIPILRSFFCLALAVTSSAAEVREKEPGADSKGKVYAWKSADGLGYHYFVPKSYDPEAGAALTFVLHGSNLSKVWGFANHKAGEFRPNDIVVCPDGTTANGQGGHNFMGQDDDIARFEALHDELLGTFKVDATYLYGHSQGSFFALHYAGAKPDKVGGVLAHASGAWAQTRMGEAGHGQAIAFMHGTQDPVVGYGQSRGGLSAYQDKGYKKVRLRSLEGWNHWPAEHNGPVPHASRQLAWIQGMSSDDPKHVGAAFLELAGAGDKEQRDFQGLYLLSARILEMPELSGKAEARAKETMAKIEALAEKHIEAMRLPAPDAVGPLDGEAWAGYLPIFLRQFSGVAPADALAKTWEPVLDAHRKAAVEHFATYRDANAGGDRAKALGAGADLLSNAYLRNSVADHAWLKKLEDWAGDRSLKIDRDLTKAFKAQLKMFRDAQEDGAKKFWAENKRARI